LLWYAFVYATNNRKLYSRVGGSSTFFKHLGLPNWLAKLARDDFFFSYQRVLSYIVGVLFPLAASNWLGRGYLIDLKAKIVTS
jgi:hypothetical protein